MTLPPIEGGGLPAAFWEKLVGAIHVRPWCSRRVSPLLVSSVPLPLSLGSGQKRLPAYTSARRFSTSQVKGGGHQSSLEGIRGRGGQTPTRKLVDYFCQPKLAPLSAKFLTHTSDKNIHLWQIEPCC